MASSTLERVPDGARIYVDAAIFIYHFTAVSADCRQFLERCEQGEVRGVTSTLTLAEVAHRLMMIEAVAAGLVSPDNVAKKLRRKPEVVRALHVYQEQVEKIPLMVSEVESIDLRVFLRSAPFRQRHGLLTNDSLVAATAGERGVEAIASPDRDFERLTGWKVFRPADI